MTDDERFDETVGRWLEETAPAGIPERVLTATFERTRGSRQHVGWRAVLGRSQMPRFLPALGGAAVLVAVAALAMTIYANQPDGPGPVASQGPRPEPTASGLLWPQSSLEEARAAQERADAGDPRFAWQVAPELRSGFGQPTDDTEIVARFLREELGWDEFRFLPIPEDGFGSGASLANAYVRCGPGETNPHYPGSTCAPTIDDRRFERVSLDLAQPVRQDATGIWVVTRWATLPPYEQAVPPSEAETNALLDGFLQARLAGAGAQAFLAGPEAKVPFLYATAAGDPYERAEFALTDGPLWPEGGMRFRVELVADSGRTVVEQLFSLERLERGLEYQSQATGPAGPLPGTTVNGQAIPVPYSFGGGRVSLEAAYPWHDTWSGEAGPSPTMFLDELEGNLVLVSDALPTGSGCGQGPASADAQALADTIRSDPDLVASAPVAASVGGVASLQMDVTASSAARMCDQTEWTRVATDVHVGPGHRARLYLLDLPGQASRTLMIAIVAPESRFESVLEAAAPVVESILFDVP